VAFLVDNVRAIYDYAVSKGAESVSAPTELRDDDGSVTIASIKTYGDTVHSLIDKRNYKGVFLPGYQKYEKDDPIYHMSEPTGLGFIDHVVGNHPEKGMLPAVEWYENALNFHRFWSVDDSQIHTEYSALRSIVMTDWKERVKLPMNEPAAGKRKSQIQEYVDYYGGPGVQHIAINVPDIIKSVTALKGRGIQFLEVPKSYYVHLKAKLAKSPIQVKEDLQKIEDLSILIDYDDKGYLLQLFTKPVEDRPTLFFEIIQRNNHQGFGVGNFKSLFEAIEAEQAKRGNL